MAADTETRLTEAQRPNWPAKTPEPKGEHWYDRLQRQPDDEDYAEPSLPPKGPPMRVRIRHPAGRAALARKEG